MVRLSKLVKTGAALSAAAILSSSNQLITPIQAGTICVTGEEFTGSTTCSGEATNTKSDTVNDGGCTSISGTSEKSVWSCDTKGNRPKRKTYTYYTDDNCGTGESDGGITDNFTDLCSTMTGGSSEPVSCTDGACGSGGEMRVERGLTMATIGIATVLGWL